MSAAEDMVRLKKIQLLDGIQKREDKRWREIVRVHRGRGLADSGLLISSLCALVFEDSIEIIAQLHIIYVEVFDVGLDIDAAAKDMAQTAEGWFEGRRERILGTKSLDLASRSSIYQRSKESLETEMNGIRRDLEIAVWNLKKSREQDNDERPREKAEPEASISKKHNQWIICFEGERWVGKNTKKIRQLVALIRNQGSPVEALELAGVDEEGILPKPMDDRTADEDAPDSSDSYPQSGGQKADAVGDRQAVREIRAKLRKLKVDLESPGITVPERHETEEEVELLSKELDRLVSPRGNLRRMSTPINKAARSVKKNLKGIIKNIEPRCPDFAAHLERSLNFGNKVEYTPTPTVLWEL